MLLNIYCDGGARGNPGPAAIGFIVKNQSGHTLHRHQQFIGTATNNVAEYHAVISALEWVTKNSDNWQLITVNFFLDSTLVVNQLNGKFKIKSAPLRQLILRVKLLESQLKTSIYYHSIPRSQNQLADSLVNLALDSSLL
ncbi:MAG: ribonuclease HI family protein [Candidatus Chisholmbacteria bacterium]|nr:ribonuclease HI family protein [Candidatus Chisholmbacteria bacterium]